MSNEFAATANRLRPFYPQEVFEGLKGITDVTRREADEY